MIDAVDAPYDVSSVERFDGARRVAPHAAFGSTVLALAAVTGAIAVFVCVFNRLDAPPSRDAAQMPAATRAPVPVIEPDVQLYGGLFIPDGPWSAVADTFAQSLTFGVPSTFVPPNRGDVGETSSDGVPTIDPPVIVAGVPLPVRRPAALRLQTTEDGARTAGLKGIEKIDPAAVTRGTSSFFDRLFGSSKTSTAALAYAAPDDESLKKARNPMGTLPGYDRQTAVYDITARTVYMPNGTRLEAHSGLGEFLDDPRYVSTPMRGATPPQVYDLTLREKLFHGVQALRMNPVGGGGIFGRTGILAHTYMLGPKGDSNGCVSFKDYDAFLQAYQRGEVKRIAVVAKLDVPADARQLVGRADTN